MPTLIGMLFAAACGLGAMLLYLRVKKYAALFGYDRRRDQTIRLDDAYVQDLSIELTDAGFVYQGLSGEWDTLLLELDIRATGLGWIVDPAIKFQCFDRKIVQYFERDARGRRYVNLSDLLCCKAWQEGARVEMRGRHITWKKGVARLRLMRTVESNGPVMVVAPHPDDAEIAAFGYYCRREAWVVTVTTGERGSEGIRDIIGEVDQQDFRSRVRLWNSLSVPMLGSVACDRIVNLGYPDGQLADLYVGRLNDAEAYQRLVRTRQSNVHKQVSKVPTHLSWDGLVEDLTTTMLAAIPLTVVAPHPLLDRHTDHQYTALAVAEAVLRSGLTTGNMLLYAVHGSWGGAHPLGESKGTLSAVPWFDDSQLAQHVFSETLGPIEQGLKALALDSMYDLRGFPCVDDPGLRKTALLALRSIYQRIVCYQTDFLRRAVRPNEFFFVVPYSRVREYFELYAQQIPGFRGEWAPVAARDVTVSYASNSQSPGSEKVQLGKTTDT